jgi:hypothetical protein
VVTAPADATSGGTRRAARRAAVALAAVALALVAGLAVVSVAAHEGRNLPGPVVVYLVAVGVGGLVAYRLPRLPIGWLLLAAVCIATLQNVGQNWLILDLRVHHGSLGLVAPAVVLAAGLGLTAFLLLAAAIMLLPDGRSPSSRWRWLSVVYGVLTVAFLVGQLVAATGIVGQHLHLDATGTPTNTPSGIYGDFGDSWFAAIAVLPVLAVWIVLQVRSYRRSAGIRRQQLNWLVAGGVISIASDVVGTVFRAPHGAGYVVFQASRVGIAAFPLALAVALLRYRLYDLDRVISRTVSYVALTGVVGGTYVGVVSLATKALDFTSPVAVAASTLPGVALFNPARRRLQVLVDRRFNRSRYDADRTVAAYRTRLRGTVDPSAVQRELLDVVLASVEPAHAALWTARRGAVEAADPLAG